MPAGSDDVRPRVVATVGVFDGVHRGHRALIETVISRAAAHGLRSLVITFDPHPVTVLADPVPPHLLTGRDLELRYLAELGVDLVWMLPFSRRLAAMEPRAFIEDLLMRRVTIGELWVGHDFRFGRGRSGDAAWLRAEGGARGFEVHEFPAVMDGELPFSSRRVRAALARGDIQDASRMLGHTVQMEGRVVRGRGQGAKVLVPTANLELPQEQFLPAHGVYAGWAELSGELVPAVANIGIRPTLVDDPRPLVEIHLLDWSGDLVGSRLGFHLSLQLRVERKFKDVNELRDAIKTDIAAARTWLVDHPFPAPGPPGAPVADSASRIELKSRKIS